MTVMEEIRIDLRNPAEADPAESVRCAQLCYEMFAQNAC